MRVPDVKRPIITERHHFMGCGPRLHKKEKVSYAWTLGALCFLWVDVRSLSLILCCHVGLHHHQLWAKLDLPFLKWLLSRALSQQQETQSIHMGANQSSTWLISPVKPFGERFFSIWGAWLLTTLSLPRGLFSISSWSALLVYMFLFRICSFHLRYSDWKKTIALSTVRHDYFYQITSNVTTFI